MQSEIISKDRFSVSLDNMKVVSVNNQQVICKIVYKYECFFLSDIWWFENCLERAEIVPSFL